MPRNGAGQYTPPTGTYGVSGTPISSSAYDSYVNDIGAEITNSINVQGSAPMLAPLNMGTFKIINGATPTAATDIAIKSYVDAAIPPGLVMAYAVNTAAPAGWLICNGASISTTTYANLFGILAYAYGGSGSSFTIPDYRGMFLRGFDNGRAIDFQGTRAPSAYQASYIINHYHAVSDPTHAHSVYDPTHSHGASTNSHSHGISDPGHNHGQSAHGHGINDPGHVHGGGILNFVGSGGSLGAPSSSPFNLVSGNTPGAGTGVSVQGGFANINAAGTGVSVNAVGNIGVNVNGAGTGIGIYGAATGISVGNVSTGNVAGPETTVQNYPVLWCIKY